MTSSPAECPVGETVTHGGCVSHLTSLPDCSEIPHGEWTNDGQRTCRGGFTRERICRRVFCAGDPRQCCTGQRTRGVNDLLARRCPNSTINDPYRSSFCQDVWAGICSGEDALDNPDCQQWFLLNPDDPRVRRTMREGCRRSLDSNEFCQEWCDTHPEGCNELLAEFCNLAGSSLGPNPLAERCRQWCTSPEGAGKCDNSAGVFCERIGPNNPFCACINSPASQFDRAYPVMCIDADCFNHGYATSTMLNNRGDRCPDVVDCSIVNNLMAGGNITFTENVFQQNCGMAEEPPLPSPPPSLPEPSPMVPSAPPEDEGFVDFIRENIVFFIIGFIFVILLAVGLIAYGTLYSGGNFIDIVSDPIS